MQELKTIHSTIPHTPTILVNKRRFLNVYHDSPLFTRTKTKSCTVKVTITHTRNSSAFKCINNVNHNKSPLKRYAKTPTFCHTLSATMTIIFTTIRTNKAFRFYNKFHDYSSHLIYSEISIIANVNFILTDAINIIYIFILNEYITLCFATF